MTFLIFSSECAAANCRLWAPALRTIDAVPRLPPA